ncbi:MAG: hypothetical protein H6711_01840 [Myxococcales bacterium]|nr:hypothetical protein [Myxococcales bacterium]
MSSRLARLIPTLLCALTLALGLGVSASAQAAPASGLSAQGQVGTSGARGSASGPKKSSGFELPERVYEGNAISALMPVQVGFLGYMPRVRLGFQYDRQLYKQQWVYIGVAALFDRGDFQTFKQPTCGLGNSDTVCGKGTVAGVDGWLGWAYKFYLAANPYLVPIARVGVGGGWWKYPKLGGPRLQALESSWSLSVRGGGGLRLFLMEDLAIGLDVNLAIGFTRSKSTPLAMPTQHQSDFLLGMEILPLIVEYRF